MIDIKHLSYEVSEKDILHDVTFSINKGDKIGLVGPNGAGKTTLLKLISGVLAPTSGEITKTHEDIGLLPQDLKKWLGQSVYSFIEEITGVKSAREQFDDQCFKLAENSSEQTLLLYSDALERYDQFEVATFDANLEKALKRADIASINVDEAIGNFSGGQRTRIALAAVFASRHDTILLDEPTNNLDERGVVVLEKFIAGSNAAFLMVSHDRRFLRNATSRIIELMGGDNGIKHYGLGYDEYIEAREKAKLATFERYDQYEKDSKRLKKAAKEANIKANSAGSNRKTSDSDKLTAHFRKEKAAKGLASAASGINTRLGQLEEPERPEEDVSLKFLFKEQSSKKLNLLSVSNLITSYDGSRPIGPISFSIRSGDKLLLKGDNGSGKTTILKSIVGSVQPSSGDVHLNKQTPTIYIDQAQTLPLPGGTALDNLRYLAPALELHEAINLLIRFALKKEVIDSTDSSKLSGGERAKVLLAGIAANNAGLLILDEPTNNLDIPTIEALEAALKDYKGGTLLVSHDRDFIGNIGITREIETGSL
ncbi:MAG: ribosomal protection-like ABC-F family protein [Candidatus Saccharimonas sp.]